MRYSSFAQLMAAMAVVIVASAGVAAPHTRLVVRRDCVPNCVATCVQTSFRHGDADGGLRVDFSGEHHEVIEVFFHHNFMRDSFKHHSELHCRAQVTFPEAIAEGYSSFALQYGDGLFRNRFAIYGIAKPVNDDILSKITNDPQELGKSTPHLRVFYVPTDDNYPVSIQWISTKLVKISHGLGQTKSMVLKFLPENMGDWVELDGAMSKSVPLVNAGT
jgi:hypothetical protein